VVGLRWPSSGNGYEKMHDLFARAIQSGRFYPRDHDEMAGCSGDRVAISVLGCGVFPSSALLDEKSTNAS
jgi:hypothetical protein